MCYVYKIRNIKMLSYEVLNRLIFRKLQQQKIVYIEDSFTSARLEDGGPIKYLYYAVIENQDSHITEYWQRINPTANIVASASMLKEIEHLFYSPLSILITSYIIHEKQFNNSILVMNERCSKIYGKYGIEV